MKDEAIDAGRRVHGATLTWHDPFPFMPGCLLKQVVNVLWKTRRTEAGSIASIISTDTNGTTLLVEGMLIRTRRATVRMSFSRL